MSSFPDLLDVRVMRLRGGSRFSIVDLAVVTFLGVFGGAYIVQPSFQDFYAKREQNLKKVESETKSD